MLSELLNYIPGLCIIVAIIIIFFTFRKEDKDDDDNLVYANDNGGFRKRKINKVVRVALSGGLIGAIGTNPRNALEKVIQKYNAEGWNCHQIYPHSTRNFVVTILQVLVLIMTLGLWTFGAGYLLLFEKDVTDYSKRKWEEHT